ncbi:hypothetical protein YC2023_072643 [Brassica napus]
MLSKVSLKISNCITIRLKMLTLNLEDFLSCKRGYRLKRHDWLNRSINIVVEVNKENYAHGNDMEQMTQKANLNFSIESTSIKVTEPRFFSFNM